MFLEEPDGSRTKMETMSGCLERAQALPLGPYTAVQLERYKTLMAGACRSEKQPPFRLYRKNGSVLGSFPTLPQCRLGALFSAVSENPRTTAVPRSPAPQPQNALIRLQQVLEAYRERVAPTLWSDASMRSYAEQLLVARRVLASSESLSKIIPGEIFAYRRAEWGAKFAIVFLDYHDDPQVQQAIADGITTLHRRGMRSLALEGDPVDHRRVYGTNDSCSGILAAGKRAACELGETLFAFGVEHPGLYAANLSQLGQIESLSAHLTPGTLCEAVRLKGAFDATAKDRGYAIAHNMLATMKHGGKDRASLVIGAAHLREVQDVFSREDVSYVMIAVPGVVEELKELRSGLTADIQAVQEMLRTPGVRIPICE